jgi:hypothetical protein
MLVLKPPCTKPTVGVAFEIKSDVAPLIEIEAITGVAPAAEPPLSDVALTRALVMRIVRDAPVVTGASTGTPKNVIVLPLTRPWNTFGAPRIDAVVLEDVDVAASTVPVVNEGLPVPTVTDWANSIQPVVGVVQSV